MKRYLAILLSVLLMMASLPMVSASGIFNDDELQWGDSEEPTIPDGPCFVVSQAEGKAGGTVDVTISAINNPGIISTKVMVSYDANVLKLLSYESGEFFAAGYSYGPEENNPFVINWMYAIGNDSTAELLSTLTFEVLADAAFGPSAITIEFSCEDDVYNSAWETVEFEAVNGGVYVLYPVTGVELDAAVLDIYNGDTATLNATVQSEGKADTSVIWESDNPNVAIVDENGVVTAVGLGSANITVTTVDGGFTASCPVNVTCAHRNTIEVEAVDSTCVVPGHDAYTLCNDCGVVIAGSDADLPLAGHQYTGEVTTDATCGDDGVMTYTCPVCGDSYTEVIPATGAHTYDNACDAQCNGCDHIRAVDPHSYENEVTTDATCGADGVMTYTCSVCGDSYTQAIPATGNHTYDNACDAECNVCGHIRAVDPHPYEDEVTTDATCGADGVMTYTCPVCGDSYTEVIPATGDHTYDNACDAECNGCDLVREVGDHVYDGIRDADCNECGDIREVSMAGDVDGNKKVNNRDLGMLQKHLNGYVIEDVDLVAAEVDGDGRVNNRDLGLIQRYINGYDVELI